MIEWLRFLAAMGMTALLMGLLILGIWVIPLMIGDIWKWAMRIS